MNAKLELVQSWLTKAQHDLAAARKLAEGPDPYLDVTVYHCQQAAEKAVKGLLVFHDQVLEKTHDVEVLVALATRYDERLASWVEAAAQLTPYARVPVSKHTAGTLMERVRASLGRSQGTVRLCSLSFAS